MRRAQERVDAFLESKQPVPQHISEARADEDRNADERNAIRPRKRVAPGIAAAVVAGGEAGKDEHQREHAGVETPHDTA